MASMISPAMPGERRRHHDTGGIRGPDDPPLMKRPSKIASVGIPEAALKRSLVEGRHTPLAGPWDHGEASADEP
jgi:hypothetical protein